MSCPTYYQERATPPSHETWAVGEFECLGLTATDSGEDVPTTQWIQRWTSPASGSPTCTDVFRNILNGEGTSETFGYTAEALDRLRTDMDYIFSKFYNTETSNKITIPGQIGYTAFTDTLLGVCRDIPGACSRVQEKMCTGCTRGDISSNNRILSLCGCFSPDLNEIYQTNNYGISFTPECDPLCTNSASIKRINEITGQAKTCNSTVCVIDSVSVNAAQTTIDGGLSFTQVCSACALANNANPCVCIVNVSINGVMEGIHGVNEDQLLSDSAILTQYCPGARCLSIDPLTNVVTQVECQDKITSAPMSIPTASVSGSTYLVAVGLFLLFLVAILAVWYGNSKITVYTMGGLTDSTRPPIQGYVPKPAGMKSVTYRTT